MACGGAQAPAYSRAMPPADAPHGMLVSFAAYLRRQLGPDGPAVAVVGRWEPLRRVPADAGVAVVAGRRSTYAERRFARRTGLQPQWRGTARARPGGPGEPFTVWDRWSPAAAGEPPVAFDVLAIVTAYNEAGMMAQTLDRLVAGGIRVHVIDNWSTDATPAIVERYLPSGRVTVERFPEDGPSPYFELRQLLYRVGEVAHESGADWVVHHDCDEIHGSAWPGMGLRQGLWVAQHFGFNCVDNTAVEFRPVADTWQPGDDVVTSFEWFEFGALPAHFTLLRAWRPQQATKPVNAETGGHRVEFDGRRVFPYKFLMRHYPLRSAAHARQKLFTDRKPRWSPEERGMGWHVQYDEYDEGTSFLWAPDQLHRWDALDEELLLQRLSGVWLPNNPFPEEAAPPGREQPAPAGAEEGAVPAR